MVINCLWVSGKFNGKSENPAFTDSVKNNCYPDKKEFTFIYSNQCPFMEEYAGLLAEISKKNEIPFNIKKLKSYEEAQETGSAFGTLGIYYNGEFITHELMSEKKFEKFIEEVKKN